VRALLSPYRSSVPQLNKTYKDDCCSLSMQDFITVILAGTGLLSLVLSFLFWVLIVVGVALTIAALVVLFYANKTGKTSTTRSSANQ
jgi:hypothetical protein